MSIALTEKQERDIEVFCQIAKENGAVVSLRELIGLAAIDASARELASAFDSHSRLKSKFLLESGYVLQRSEVAERDARKTVEDEARRRECAEENLRRASRFGNGLVRETVIVSVSGGNSYLSASEDEDIDFFCVTRTDGMWIFILRGLILARLHRLANKDVPQLCFSCTMDERRARQEFREKQSPIFARDALTAKVIGGHTAYHSLLREAEWMEVYFPSFYGMRLRETALQGRRWPPDELGERRGSAVLNSFLYHTLGSFLRMKSWALNRKLTKTAWHSSIFETRIGKGHYVLESNRYRNLRRLYADVKDR